MLDPAAAESSESRFIAAPDGVMLHIRCYGQEAPNLPVLCLPGLARTEADFEPLARYLTTDARNPRQVFALDSRGRGRSGHDPDWRNYNLAVELADVVAVLGALSLAHAVLVGTSRGGMLTMLLGAAHPAMLAGAVLNDIGPVVEPDGLFRIKGYVGKLPRPRDHAEGVAILRETFAAQFPRLSAAEWLAWAERSWRPGPDGLVGCYDPNIARTLDQVLPENPLPDLWAPFDAMPQIPLMVVRGALSDILSRETVAAMRARRSNLETIEVADQGHAPVLAEPAVLAEIAAFIARCDRVASAIR